VESSDLAIRAANFPAQGGESMKNIATIFVVAILAAAGAQAWAQTVTIPNSFTSDTAISANDMNANFNAVAAAINTLQTKLNSAQWAYASPILSYMPTDGSISIGKFSRSFRGQSTTHFMQISQSGASATLCIANLNGKKKDDGGVTDPNEALKIIGGNDTGDGGALIEFFRPSGARLGYICQDGNNQISWGNDSDRRLKEGIVDTRYSLDQLMKIQVRDFFFINDPVKELQTGFIAQELYDAYPDAVCKPEGEDGMWGVDYSRLSPLLVKSIQDQQKEIDALKQENAELKARIAAIEKKLGM
jgi:hypothetical protein